MGIQHSKSRTLTDSDIRLISQQTQLEPHIIQQLYEAFMERAGNDGRMTISDFKKTYTEIDPNANFFTLDNDAERFFMMFDRDRNGVLTFDEFMMAYILLQRGSDVPANRWYNAINTMPVGVISRPSLLNSEEALRLLQYMHQFYQIPNFDPVMEHNLLWGQLAPQLDPSGYIPQSEYLRLFSAQPNIQPHVW
ncbi:unnamed protein product [Rotaria socialis]|uniref:EF-hand domain-containing protein n=1 Tax=Rotaria socialis TaxID=392032 RepID=A0A820ALB6_9BILA|nr:unnamed protein product [Rotaria socialis]CAF4195093.1 unnamed protein product [Rotaria socialis]